MNLFYKIIITLFLALVLVTCSKKGNQIQKKQANALIKETSPYLLQHAYNPVDWNAWNTESLEKAKKENKLIIVSIGYSSCHWCHVMEEESFENDSVAKVMNSNFINIKVDREERPDIDQIYMNAVQLMTGNGGWPLNCITLPDGRPVFGGTYFTKKQWLKVLDDLSKLYEENPQKVISYAEKLTEGIKNSELITLNTEKTTFKKENLSALVNSWKPNLDFKYGGELNVPKFPMPGNLSFLLRYSVQNNDEMLKGYVINTLTKMSYGGIYDAIGGGFSRYSVDEKWHIPHFEKMLYDNAQLVSLYADAYALTKDENFKETILETLNFVNRELTGENGAFYSSVDADSKNENGILEEGAFYAWKEPELKTLLNNDFTLFAEYYNINSFGKWENDTFVLIKQNSDEAFAKSKKITVEDLDKKIKKWKTILFEARNKRERPRTDDKILTSWNGLMLKAYVDAYKVLDNKDYLNAALKNARFLKENQIQSDGGLNHNFKDGKSTIDGFLEDYAILASAYISLYEVTLDISWLNTANALVEYIISHFLDKKTGMFYFTSDKDTNLITRKMELSDNVIPSSNSITANNLFKLSHYYSNSDYAEKAKQMLKNLKSDIELSPSGYSNWLYLFLNYSNPYYEVAISGNDALQKTKVINHYYLPNILIAGALNESPLPLMKNRYNPEETYIYICVDGACKLPEVDVEKVINQLSRFNK